MSNLPSIASEAVLVASEDLSESHESVVGYDFNNGVDYEKIMGSYLQMGFQGTNLGLAIEEIKKMRAWRLSDDAIMEEEAEDEKDMDYRKNVKCKLFLGYTSNLISSGLRETFRFLAQHKMVHCVFRV